MTRLTIDSEHTGTALRDYETAIQARDIMNYSAAIGDGNPRYFNDESPGGIVAHPLYPVAVTWNILGKIREFIVSEKFPADLLLSQVHYTEHLEIHRLLTPGLQLVIRGRIAAILPHRAGTHVVIRLDARDPEGNPVFTEHIGGMLRGVECLGGGSGGESLPRVLKAGTAPEPCWTAAVPIDRLLPYVYDGCTNIVFPIHTSVKFAHMVGLPGIILQGTATLARALTELVDRELGGDPSRIRSLSCRFTGMVLPGSDISVSLVEKRKNEKGTDLFFEVSNTSGERVLSGGCLSAV